MNAHVGVIAVRAEAIHDLVERTPGVKIGKQREVDRIGEFGVTHLLNVIADEWS